MAWLGWRLRHGISRSSVMGGTCTQGARKLRVMRCAGTSLIALLCAVWVAERVWSASLSYRGYVHIDCSNGCLTVGSVDSGLFNDVVGMARRTGSPLWTFADGDIAILLEEPGDVLWWSAVGSYAGPDEIRVPLWMPIVVFAIPTAYAWYRCRRRPSPDQCSKCGYDLAGIEAHVCPECGKAIM